MDAHEFSLYFLSVSVYLGGWCSWGHSLVGVEMAVAAGYPPPKHHPTMHTAGMEKDDHLIGGFISFLTFYYNLARKKCLVADERTGKIRIRTSRTSVNNNNKKSNVSSIHKR